MNVQMFTAILFVVVDGRRLGSPSPTRTRTLGLQKTASAVRLRITAPFGVDGTGSSPCLQLPPRGTRTSVDLGVALLYAAAAEVNLSHGIL